MSIRIVLDNGPPEFFSNLDTLSGRVLLNLNRAEQVGAVVVKLEGECRTSLGVPAADQTYPGNSAYPGARPPRGPRSSSAPGQVIHENHKILYRVQQVFPSPDVAPMGGPVWLQPGSHTFSFRFKIPMNNMCGDPRAMAQIGGLGGVGGFADGAGGLFGIGNIRVMDGSRQLLYAHVNKPLPPTFTSLPHQAEVDYYVKVTIQRPGLLKENWRYKTNFRLLPLEPTRPKLTGQEAYARRPFTFRPRSPTSASAAGEAGDRKKKSFFGSGFGGSSSKKDEKSSNNPFFTSSSAAEEGGGTSTSNTAANDPSDPNNLNGPLQRGLPPSVEMSARLPYPSILTMGKPLPLKMMAKKLAPSRGEHVFLTSLQVELIATTKVRCNELSNVEVTRLVLVSRSDLKIPVMDPEGPVGSETALPSSLWDNSPLPGALGQAGMTPTFTTCNLSRSFSLELKVGLSWGLRETLPRKVQPQTLILPLVFSSLEVYSGVSNPQLASNAEGTGQAEIAPALPPRAPAGANANASSATTAGTSPSVGPSQNGHAHVGPASTAAAPEYEAPPPSYEEAMNSKT